MDTPDASESTPPADLEGSAASPPSPTTPADPVAHEAPPLTADERRIMIIRARRAGGEPAVEALRSELADRDAKHEATPFHEHDAT